MNLLILGGTQFVGRHVVNAALERGHGVTLFSRGLKENPFPDLEHLTGDRSTNLSALEKRTFDAVVDVSGYTPSQLERSCATLEGQVGRYLFISTVSVYADPDQHGPDETSALQTQGPVTEDVTPESYGPLKVLAEKVVLERFANRATVVRPHFVVGAFDHTDRFTSWVHKFARGGEVLLGGSKQTPCQFVDARDLAGLTLHLLEHDLGGTFNAASDTAAWNDVLEQKYAVGSQEVVGMMIESHIHEGKQGIPTDGSSLKYGVSVTDACIGWEETETLLAAAFEHGRKANPTLAGA